VQTLAPENYPTPIARVALRVVRCAEHESAERFLSLGYLAETYLKYTTLVIHSMVQTFDHNTAAYWGYRLAHNPGLGEWTDAIGALSSSTRIQGIRDWPRELPDWFSARQTGRRAEAWFSDAYDSAARLWEIARGPRIDFIRSVRGILDFLVSFRNKTRGHGAFPPGFYERVNPILVDFLAILLDNSKTFDASLRWYSRAPTGSIGRLLQGIAPTASVSESTDYEDGLWLAYPAGEVPIRFSPLLSYEPASDSCYFSNNAWISAEQASEGLDYSTGEKAHLRLDQYSLPPVTKPRSETAGRADLIAEVHASHNLPTLVDGYVDRTALESQLGRLLSDRLHRIITLHGMGGVGKTTLALKTSLDLVRSTMSPFELVLWFSARDIDLLTEGPAPREREVRDIEQVAQFFCRVMGGSESALEAVEVFTSQVGDSTNRMLLIMDNFETLDDPDAVHEYLDNHVVLPNKVLITSRLRTFKGDYPVEVRGMESKEAEDLLRREARRNHCEPLMTPDNISRIYDYTAGVPYAMKLVVAQLSQHLRLGQVIDKSLSDERILDALFLRSYGSLPPDAKRLFLLIGNLRSDITTVPLKTAFAAARRRFDNAFDECERASLLEVIELGTTEFIHMPQAAKNFAKKQLVGYEEQLEIERDLRLITDTYQFAGGSPDEAERYATRLTSLISRASDKEIRGELTEALDALAQEFPSTWLHVAKIRRQLNEPPTSVREAFRMAVQHEPNRRAVWEEWADFEKLHGDWRREVELLVRAAESEPDNLTFNSYVAWRLAHLITRNIDAFPIADRRMWIASVKDNLASRFNDLDADMLARLGWLYYLEHDRVNSIRCARRGLTLTPRHEHCRNILRRYDEDY
jgi:NB-ARC domain